MALSSASANPLTNEQMVISSVRDGVFEDLKQLDLKSVRLDLNANGLKKTVAGGIVEGLKNAGVDVYNADLSDTVGYELRFDIMGFDFSYKNGKSRGFLRKRMINRVFDSIIRITVIELENGAVRLLKDISISSSDQIDPELVQLVRSREIPELAPTQPSSGWSRLIEPAVVSVAVGALVYLFFANR